MEVAGRELGRCSFPPGSDWLAPEPATGSPPGPSQRKRWARLTQGAAPASPEEVVSAWPGNVPAPLTTFVGRSREMTEVMTLLAASRLVTLTGVAGIGKTRLALQLAPHLAQRYPDYQLIFVVASEEDPAYGYLKELLRESPYITCGDTPEELARNAGIDAATFAQTLRDWNALLAQVSPERISCSRCASGRCARAEWESASAVPGIVRPGEPVVVSPGVVQRL